MLQLNMEGLHKVMQDFYTLTKIRIVIFDAQFRELLAYPTHLGNFCRMLRQTKEGEASCFSSDKNGCKECAKNKEPVIYRCHAGLTEAVVPIMDNGGILAYVMFGQIIPEEHREEARSEIIKRNPQLAEEVDSIPIKSQRELNAAATVLQAITAYVITNNWVVPSKSEFIRKLDQYIQEHLAETSIITDICKAFHIGRTKLYEISMDYLGCGVAEYIRKQRIAHAKQLLIQTDLPITGIAAATGFSDYNIFSRIFKQLAGVSARQYRNLHKQRP